MPAIGAALVANIAIFGVTVGVGAAIAIHAAAAIVLGAWQKKQLSRDQGRSAPLARDVMIRSTIEPKKIVYGEAALSGPVFWVNSYNQTADTFDLYFAVAHAGHEIDSFQGFYIDEKFIPIADIAVDGAVTVDTTGHGYAQVDGDPVLWLRGHLGADSQTADTFLTTDFSTIWTTDHRVRGTAYTVARLRRQPGTEEVWEGGPPQTIQAVIRGKKVYDPRLDSTQAGGSGAHRVDTPSTWTHSRNPVLCTRDYLVDARLGAGKHWDHTRFDYTHISEQADICDALVSIPGGTQARYSCDGVLSCGSSHEDNLTTLFSSMNGRPAYKNGKFYIFAGAWEAPTFVFNEKHLAGDIEYRKQPDSNDRFNQIRGVYFDQLRQYKQVEFLPVNDTATRSGRDKNKVLSRDVTLSMVNNEYQAQRLAFGLVYQCEDTGTLGIPVNAAGLQFEIGDPIAIDNERLGWLEKPFRIVGLKHGSYNNVTLVCREYNEASYADPDEDDYGVRTEAGALTFPTWLRDDGTYIQDPQFSRSVQMWDGVGAEVDGNHLRYLWRDRSTGDATAIISRTGGAVGGLVELFCDATEPTSTAKITSIPRASAVFVAGEYVRCTLRIRKTNNPTLSAAQFTAGAGAATWAGAIASSTDYGFFPLDHTDINAWTVDVFENFEWSQQTNTAGPWSASSPYIAAEVALADVSHDLRLEVDMFNVVPIGTP